MDLGSGSNFGETRWRCQEPTALRSPENIKRRRGASAGTQEDLGVPGQKLVLGIVVIIVLAILGIFLTPLRWSVFGMKGSVGFVGAHTTKSMEDSSDVGYMKLREFLRNSGYEAKQIQTPSIRLADLQAFDACILLAPESALEQEEIDAIGTYVNGGGGFLISSTGWGSDRLTYVNNLTEGWGFRYMNTKCYEPEQSYTDYGVSVSQYTVAALGLVEGNPIADRVTYPYVMRNSCTIEVTDPSKATTAITLIGFAFGEHADHQDLKPNDEHGEPVAEDAIVMVNGELGSGRLVGIGGHDFLMNKWIFQSKPAENAKIVTFILDWLTKQ
jgi:hypothetical protein